MIINCSYDCYGGSGVGFTEENTGLPSFMLLVFLLNEGLGSVSKTEMVMLSGNFINENNYYYIG